MDMLKVVTSDEMRAIDRITTERFGIPSSILMENAAHAAAGVIAEKLGGSVQGRSVLVFCGKGNNGGDGAALARILWQQGADVEVCLFGLVEDTKGDARVNFEILRKISGSEDFEMHRSDLAFEEIANLEEWLDQEGQTIDRDEPDVIVDALFGTGLKRPLEGVFAEAAAYIDAFGTINNDSSTFVVSLDLPSGLDADKGESIGINPNAHITVTFTAPKIANVLPPASRSNGELRVVNIGSPKELVNQTASSVYVAEMSDAREWLSATEFTPDSFKNKRGHALLVAGSRTYSGAAALCGNAAMRTGVGLVTVATPASAAALVTSRVMPELIVRGIVGETADGAFAEEAFERIAEFWEKADAVAVGSGISSDDVSTGRFVRKLVEARRTPVVIDADGLNLLAPFDLVGSAELPLILTPHEGEFRRLLGSQDKTAITDRIAVCREFAVGRTAILVLKGERTIIAGPDGRVVINPTGNSGLGRAGNGDTLTGIITGFVAQAAKMKIDIFESVVAAVYLAGLAGDIADRKFGKRIMTATQVSECLGDAFDLAMSIE